jgi:FAD/FMN-containing dehydrogenase
MTDIHTALSAAVGASQVFAADDIDHRYRTDLGGRISTDPAFLVRPRTTAEVSAILRIAHAEAMPVVTQGGRTGTVQGALAEAGSIVLSLERMNTVEELDPLSMTLTIEAGATLQAAHEAAEAAGLFLPLDLGSRGTATIGGVISTNAGGVRAIRWGLARDMVLGLEAVLADGTIVTGLKKTIKDNAGYDWKHLLIGSEGTLGVVTRATLRLRPMPRTTLTALIATDDFAKVFELLRDLDLDLGGQLTSFEVMWGHFYRVITEGNRAKRPPPMAAGHPFYVLVEAMGGDVENDPEQFQAALAAALDRGQATDVVIAQSGRERDDLWAVREDLGEVMGTMWPMFAFDVSCALSDMPATAECVTAALLAEYPDAQILTYGHAGDGNLHIVVGVGDGGKEAEHRVDMAIYNAIQAVGGSISAEHGIGITKRDHLHFSRSEAEIALMWTLKRALDPRGILNPGKVLPKTIAALQ